MESEDTEADLVKVMSCTARIRLLTGVCLHCCSCNGTSFWFGVWWTSINALLHFHSADYHSKFKTDSIEFFFRNNRKLGKWRDIGLSEIDALFGCFCVLRKPVIAPFRRGSCRRKRNLTQRSTPREANRSLSVAYNRHSLFTSAYKLDCIAGQIS